MKKMEEMILKYGKVLPGNILKVGSFLNQQVDVSFLTEAGKEIARLFQGTEITKILTIEASGIPLAILVAQAIGVPAVVIKKHSSANQSKEVYTAEISSFTHKNTYTAAVAKEYLNASDKVLIVDDFLAVGNAIKGMRDILAQAGAELVGCAIGVEKCFQNGGDELRKEGIHVESLAMVESMTDDSLTFRK